MPLFILSNLFLSFIQLRADHIVELVATDTALYFCIGTLLVGLIILVLIKQWQNFAHDLFLSGLVWSWFSDWHGDFQPDAPMFFFFPLYFCFLTVFIAFRFNRQQLVLEPEIREKVITISHSRILNFSVILCLTVSVFIKSHFLLFPIAMTFYLLRYALWLCSRNLNQ